MILISGATGLVGRHLLAELLKREPADRLRAMYRSEEKKATVVAYLSEVLDASHSAAIAQIDWVQVDMMDVPELEIAFEGVQYVYHCAGMVSFDMRDKDILRKINIEGTANMVNIALVKDVKKFCLLSSVAALGSEPKGKATRENSPRNPDKTYSYYEISKYGAEMETWRASQEGLPVVIVNPGIIIGAGNWESGSGRLFSQTAKGFPFRIPKQSGFVGVEDVCRGMIDLMESDIVNQGYIMVAESLPMTQLTDWIARELKVKPPKIDLKKWMVRLMWMWQSFLYLFGGKKEMTRQSIQTLFKTTLYDNSKLKRALGFTYTPIEEVVVKTAKTYNS